MNGLQFAADAVHGIVATIRLGRVVVHAAADGRAAVLDSWLEERLKSEKRKAENIFVLCKTGQMETDILLVDDQHCIALQNDALDNWQSVCVGLFLLVIPRLSGCHRHENLCDRLG